MRIPSACSEAWPACGRTGSSPAASSLRDYNRRDFHPDDHDTVELLARWRQWWEASAA